VPEGDGRGQSHRAQISAGFSTLPIPVVYTPGENEWTDCHRANNGAYDPLERLSALRQVFFPVAGLALGGGMKQVYSQSSVAGLEKFVENQIRYEDIPLDAFDTIVQRIATLSKAFGKPVLLLEGLHHHAAHRVAAAAR